MSHLSFCIQAIATADFVNDNSGVWGLVALPLAALAAIAAVLQAIPALKTAVRDDAHNLELLRNQIRRRRVDFDLKSRLSLGRVLPARLRKADGADEGSSSAGLYDRICGGAQVLVAGGAGAGKTILALTLVDHSVNQPPTRPLMEIIPLQRWHPPLGRWNNWRGLTRWMATSLNHTYPSFGDRYFRRLLRTQGLIPCLDGLDEVPDGVRGALLEALESYVDAGLPVVVLSRNRNAVTVHPSAETVARTPGFELFELCPLETKTLASVVDSRGAWKGVVAHSTQPHRVAHLLSNPLTLSIAALTWGPNERPKPLMSSEDPEDALWHAFLDRTLGARSGDAPSPRARAAWIAFLSRQRKRDTFRLGELYMHPLAAPVTVLIATLVIMGNAWTAAPPLGLSVLASISIAAGLSPIDHGPLNRVHNRFAHRISRYGTLFWMMLIAAPAIFLCAGLFRNIMIQSVATAHGSSPLWLHLFDQGMIASWWHGGGEELAGNILVWEFPVWFALMILMLLWVGTSDLTHPLGGPDLLPRWAPWLTTLPIGAAALALGFFVNNATLVYMSMVLLVPWIFLVVSRLALRMDRTIPWLGLAGAGAELAAVGILYGDGRMYRFRHDELSRRLAEEALSELAARNAFGRVSEPRAMSGLVGERLTPDVLAESSRITEGLARTYSSCEAMISVRTLLLYYGELRPEAALEPLGKVVRVIPHTSLRVHVAEILDAVGRREEASQLWSELMDSYPNSVWFLNKWTRRQAIQGSQGEAVEFLKRITTAPGKTPSPATHLLLAELMCKFGSDADRMQATESLERTARIGDPDLRQRALLELARVKAELNGDLEGAERMVLSVLLDGLLEPLVYARQAQLRRAAGDKAGAEQLGREAAGILTWNEDPTYVLETLATIACVSETLAPAAEERALAILGFGWWLPGRRQSLLDGDGAPEGLLDRVFGRLRPGEDDDLANVFAGEPRA